MGWVPRSSTLPPHDDPAADSWIIRADKTEATFTQKIGQAKDRGRAKGTPNKVNQSIPKAIQMAFEQAGGVEYLVRLAQEDPKTFVPLLIKTMPPESKVQGENGLNIRIDLT